MNVPDLLDLILKMKPGQIQQIYLDVEIEFRGYSGLVAKNAYNKSWKLLKHKNRYKIGLFDFRVLVNGKPPDHITILNSTVKNLSDKIIEEIYGGISPESISTKNVSVLHQIQLLFLEQEINYGNEEFHAFTHFNPPRDFFMAYLLRSLKMSKKDALLKIIEWRDKAGVIRKPPRGGEWEGYLKKGKKWLQGELLQNYIKKANLSPNNPYY